MTTIDDVCDDLNRIETTEWLDALDAVVEREPGDCARELEALHFTQ